MTLVLASLKISLSHNIWNHVTVLSCITTFLQLLRG